MKLVKAFVHHVRSAAVVEALADAGFRNITLHDVIGALKPLTDSESKYSVDADRLMISEVRISLVVEDRSVDEVTSIIRRVAAVGPGVSGFVYVSPVEQVLPIGGSSML